VIEVLTSYRNLKRDDDNYYELERCQNEFEKLLKSFRPDTPKGIKGIFQQCTLFERSIRDTFETVVLRFLNLIFK
jgi:hypothetical protein